MMLIASIRTELLQQGMHHGVVLAGPFRALVLKDAIVVKLFAECEQRARSVVAVDVVSLAPYNVAVLPVGLGSIGKVIVIPLLRRGLDASGRMSTLDQRRQSREVVLNRVQPVGKDLEVLAPGSR